MRKSPLVKQTWSILQLLYSLRNGSNSSLASGRPFRVVGSNQDKTTEPTSSTGVAGEEASTILGTDDAFPPLRSKENESSKSKREAHRAEMATSHGYSIGSYSHEMSEQLLLRDIVFALQGIDGEYIKYDSAVKGYVVDAAVGVPGTTRQLIRKICEAGWLFRQVSLFLARCSASHTAGLVHQGMCQAMQTEVTEFYRLIAVLKEQVNIDISGQSDNNGESGEIERLSLRRLYVWIQDPIERLRLMAALAHGTGSLHGGALASAVHSHTQHGDPFVNRFITTQITALAAPILDMTRQWIVEVRVLACSAPALQQHTTRNNLHVQGVLNDPFLEFFVVADPAVTSENLWQDKFVHHRHLLEEDSGLHTDCDLLNCHAIRLCRYSLNERMIPSFMSRATAVKILKIGKSLNFLRQCCEVSRCVAGVTPARLRSLTEPFCCHTFGRFRTRCFKDRLLQLGFSHLELKRKV